MPPRKLTSRWTHSGWTVWKWISVGDLDDLVVDGRVVEGLGRRWLLPAGSPVKSIHSLQDVSTARAREVIVGLDPGGAWAAQAKAISCASRSSTASARRRSGS